MDAQTEAPCNAWLWSCSLPTELREISFRETEFFSAVRDYRLRRGEPLPVGSVLGIDFADDATDLSATIRIGQDDGPQIISVAVPTESIAAALIFFCINHKIPLPAHAAKSIKKMGESVALVININGFPDGNEAAAAENPNLRPDGQSLN